MRGDALDFNSAQGARLRRPAQAIFVNKANMETKYYVTPNLIAALHGNWNAISRDTSGFKSWLMQLFNPFVLFWLDMSNWLKQICKSWNQSGFWTSELCSFLLLCWGQMPRDSAAHLPLVSLPSRTVIDRKIWWNFHSLSNVVRYAMFWQHTRGFVASQASIPFTLHWLLSHLSIVVGLLHRSTAKIHRKSFLFLIPRNA